MAYTRYVFGNYDIWNITPDDTTSASAVKLDPQSSATQIVAIPVEGQKVFGSGTFTYGILKNTLGDVLAGKLDEVLIYENDVLVSREIYEPSADFRTVVFGTYMETMKLYSGDDQFLGSPDVSLEDAVRGFGGNDSFTGYGSGEFGDYFNGDAGFDVAYLRGFKANYTIQQDSIWDPIKEDGSMQSVIKVTDSVKDRDGFDFYVNVERLKFADKVVALDSDGNAGQAYRLYQAALDRTPDETGLAGWIKFMDEGGALTNMAQQFIDSQEFRLKYGALDNRNFVNQLYLNVLDRNGEASGIDGWVNGLNNGLSRAQVLAGFSESTENQQNVLGQIQNGIAYSEWWLS